MILCDHPHGVLMTYNSDAEDEKIQALIILTRVIVTYDQDSMDGRSRIRLAKPDKTGRLWFTHLEDISATFADWQRAVADLMARVTQENENPAPPLDFTIPCR